MLNSLLYIKRYTKLFFTLVWALVIGCGAGSSGGNNGPAPQPLNARFVIDGLVDLSTMGNVRSMSVDFVDITHLPS